MRRKSFFLFLCLHLVFALQAQVKEVKLKFIETSDVHGNYFPYNFMERKTWIGSLARVHAMVQKEREIYKDRLILVDNGDILQGQPTVYYYNFIDTVVPHLTARMMNYMKYDAGNMGNHDVETGHAVYDRWIKQCDFPILGANIIRTSDNSNYLKPYQMFEREGVKIAILGMITPAIPIWLPEQLWSGLRFEDMEETARKWMKVIRDEEKADVVIGLFHAGQSGNKVAGKYNENASLNVARNIPGFDVGMLGHDHQRALFKTVNTVGDSVLVVDPASNAFVVANVDIKVYLENGKVKDKKVTGTLSKVDEYGISGDFMKEFEDEYNIVDDFVSKKIGTFTNKISTKPAYFGPSAFIDLIHTLQLTLTGADISFAAPLSFNAEIPAGDVKVSDMFNLYKYENMLYTMSLTGQEVKDFLEMSYALWTNRMHSPEDHLLLLKENEGVDERQSFKNFSFNFDSAAGIIYTVDVTKPEGEKIHVISMADGTAFDKNKKYKVALNSYRGNGGGELLTKGAGISQEELPKRIITSTDRDLRYYLMKYIETKRTIAPQPLNQWKFIPEEWVKPAAERDYKLLFGN